MTNPIDVFQQWLAEAEDREINDPNAMALATVNAGGMPSVRMVLLKGIDERGFVFYTNSTSQKGVELKENNKAALCFHWKSLRKQVRVQGAVVMVDANEADTYFATRPRGSRIGAWASDQSSPLADRETLQAQVKAIEERYPEGTEIPRPPFWNGYRVIPQRIELWSDGEYRLHDRFVYTRDENGQWQEQRLSP